MPSPSPALRASTFVVLVTLTLAACGGGSDGVPAGTPVAPDGSRAPAGAETPDDGTGSSPVRESAPADGDPVPIAGDIVRYGVIAVGDENGAASGDALASFSRLSTGVGAAAFGAALSPSASLCTVERDDGRPDLTTVSRLYLPLPAAVSLEAIDAGESVLLSSTAGTWNELQARPSDAFYTRPFDRAAPDGAVPDDLVANVTGAAFPAFVDARLPAVTPLADIVRTGDGNIDRDTRFTWRPSGTPDTRVRIESETDGGFFLGASTRVSCLVPDTGEFTFPPETRTALGADFDGTEPDLSRVAIGRVRQGDALLVLVRESFAR